MTTPAKKKRVMKIDRNLCKGCRICIAFCPGAVLEQDEDEKAVIRFPEKCKGCGMCELRCPDMAIECQ